MALRKRRLLAAAAATSALLLTFAGNAYAGDALNAYEPAGAEAWGTVNWINNGNSLTVTGRSLRDVECDGNQVYVQVFIKDYVNRTESIKSNRKSDGCGTISLADVRWDAGGRPHHAWLTVCEDNWGGDDCSDSRISDNPYD